MSEAASEMGFLGFIFLYYTTIDCCLSSDSSVPQYQNAAIPDGLCHTSDALVVWECSSVAFGLTRLFCSVSCCWLLRAGS